jgi:hypothetical protein
LADKLIYKIVPDEKGYYNETIEANYYTISISLDNETFILYNVPIFEDLFNPIVFGKIDTIKVGSGALKAYSVDTIFRAISTIVFDYSDVKEKVTDYRLLGIYYCNDWIRYQGCNSTWVRLRSISTPNYKVYAINVSNLTGAFALAQYICGNNICEREYGENEQNCPIDCRAVPGVGVPSPAPGIPAPAFPTIPGVGVGIGAGVGVGRITVPFEVLTQYIETKLKPEEFVISSIDIANNDNSDLLVKIEVKGPIWDMIQFEKTEISIKPKTREQIRFKIFVPEGKAPGIYNGEIILKIRSETYVLPVTIKVELPPEPLLDVILNVLTKTLEPNQTLKFVVRVVNMGQTERVEDIVLTYTIKDLETGKVYYVYKETIAVETVLTLNKEVVLPVMPTNRKYVVEVNASYWYGRKFAYSADTFDLIELPVPVKIFRSILLSPITYIVVFGITPALYFARQAWTAYKLKKLKEKRYALPIDLNKLPKAGPNSIKVGKIAETDIDAYFDIKQLIMHTIAAGGTGSGKTVSAMVVAEELLKRGVPVIVFDPTAQWTGFIKPCKDPTMIERYKRFGLKPEDARGFKTNIIVVEDPDMPIDIKKYMVPGEITVFVLNRLKADELDRFIRRSIDAIFDMKPPESKELKLLLVYDEIHRTLPKYGGKGGYIAIERGAREFRKWGIGLYLISQVLLDFKGAIRANVATEIQLRTKYEGDINRVKQKYGADYASKVTKLTIGTGIVQNPEYNNGKPWIVEFRPLLHSTFALTKEELDEYVRLSKRLEKAEEKVKELKGRGIDTFDIESEINIARDRLKQGMFRMVETYLESIEEKLKK